jgi:hypothetical protein
MENKLADIHQQTIYAVTAGSRFYPKRNGQDSAQ